MSRPSSRCAEARAPDHRAGCAGRCVMLRRGIVGFTNRRLRAYAAEVDQTDRQKDGYAMASVLTIWCTTRQCEVVTDLWLDADALIDLAQQSDSIRCTVCGRPHSLKEAYLKPAPPQARPMASTLAAQLQQRRANAH